MDLTDRLRKWFKDEDGVRILQILVFWISIVLCLAIFVIYTVKCFNLFNG